MNNRTCRILLVEDHPDSREVLERMLRRLGHGVTTAATFAEAKQLCGQRTWDILLADIGLPDGDGADLAREILRACPTTCCVALTGYGSPHDVERIRAAGFHFHILKPVSVGQLKEVFESCPPHQPLREPAVTGTGSDRA